ncbi:MAG: ABC transporter ATP-binding protein [Bacillota bacterium]|nr:MAG: ABC transporter ATP-binding protein [Bacillota bacterium]
MRVEVEGLRKNYGSVEALKGIDLAIDNGMFGLLGPNGAGKTTLMRVVTTLLAPTAGRVTVGGIDVTRRPGEVRRLLGYLPQEFGLWKRLRAGEVLDYVSHLKGIAPAERRRAEIDRVLRIVGLSDKARDFVGGFSGGMRQRLGIAQALLDDPKLLVVDEPTAGLDPEERVRFRNFLSELSGDRVVILSTHIVADVESACTAMALLRDGRLLYVGSPEDLCRRARGKVWEAEVTEAAYRRLRTAAKVVSTRRAAGGVIARVVSDGSPTGSASPVEPDLQDAYIAAMGGVLDA